ncbi:MAG: pitrilysin family protein [Thermoanaerobaculia bacterium]
MRIFIFFLFILSGMVIFTKTLYLEDNTSPTIVLRIQFFAGSEDDPPGKKGLANLVAQMIIEGGTKGKTYSQVQKELWPLAADYYVIVDKETTTFIGEVHRDNFNKFYKTFKDLILEPRFDKEDFFRIKKKIINYLEKDLKSGRDEELGKEVLQQAIYKGHPYEHPVIGLKEDLENISLLDVKAFYEEMYRYSNLKIGIGGPVNETLVKKIEKDFAKLKTKLAASQKIIFPEKPVGMNFLLVKKDTMASAISIGFPLEINRSSPDFIPLMVATSYLGEHRTFNGILMIKMREKRGLNYGDYAYPEHFLQDGGSTFALPNIPRKHQYFSIWIRPVAKENALFSVKMALFELKKLIEEGIPEKNFYETVNFLKGYSKLWVQSLTRRLGYLMDSDTYGYTDFIKEIDQRLKNLKREEVSEVVKKYLTWENLHIVIIHPEPEKIKKLLELKVPTPITYQTPSTPCEVLEEDKIYESFELKPSRIEIINAENLFLK